LERGRIWVSSGKRGGRKERRPERRGGERREKESPGKTGGGRKERRPERRE
jgi:hypothetical protein